MGKKREKNGICYIQDQFFLTFSHTFLYIQKKSVLCKNV